MLYSKSKQIKQKILRKKEVMIMANKMTKRDWFEVLAIVVANSEIEQKDEALAFIAHEIELLNRKSTRTELTKTQKENVTTMETIKEVLADAGEVITISTMLKDERLAGFSNQKISALLKKMVTDGSVVRTEEKKKAFFSLA